MSVEPRSWETRFANAIVAQRRWVLLAVALVAAAAVALAARVRFDASIEIWFMEDDPGMVDYRTFLDRFGADELMVIGWFADDVFTPEILNALDAYTAAAERWPHAHRVQSLANVEVVEGGDGAFATVPLMPRPPTDAASAAVLRARAMDTPWLVGQMLTPKADATAVLVELDREATGSFEHKVAMVDAARALAAELAPPGVTLRLGGAPPVDEAFMRYSERDFMVLGPVSLLLVFLVSMIVFRRLSATLVPMAVVLLANAIVFGVMGLAGIDVNIISTGLVALIAAVGVADAIHLMSDYYGELAAGHDRRRAIVGSTSSVLVPCLLTSVTTAVGFLSLVSSSLKPVREFGWLAAIGVTAAFLLTVTLVPALLSFIAPPDENFLHRQRRGPMTRLLRGLAEPGARLRAVALIGAVLAAIGAAVSIPKLEFGANAMNYFRPGAPVRQDAEIIDRELGGSTTVDVLVEAAPGALTDPSVLRRIDAVAAGLRERPGIGATISVADVVREVHRVMAGVEDGSLPGEAALLSQYYLLLGGDEQLDALMTPDHGAARITARAYFSEAKALTAAIPEVEAWLATQSDERLRFKLTGYIKLMANMEMYLLDSQTRSFSIAFVVISLLMFVMLRSLKLGLLAMIPNLLPIVLGLGFMGAVGIPLDPGTVMIASIALGLVVDDTIHLLVRLRRGLSTGQPTARALAAAMHAAGRPIVTTSVLLGAGFGVLALGSFQPNAFFGAITAMVIVLALICDLVVLPAVLLLGGGGTDDGSERQNR